MWSVVLGQRYAGGGVRVLLAYVLLQAGYAAELPQAIGAEVEGGFVEELWGEFVHGCGFEAGGVISTVASQRLRFFC